MLIYRRVDAASLSDALPTPLPTLFQRPSNGVCVPTPHTPHGRWNRPPVGRRPQRPRGKSSCPLASQERDVNAFLAGLK
jgi:hypothetical protein